MDLLPSFTLKIEPDNISIPVFSMKAATYLQKIKTALEKAEVESSESIVAKQLTYVWSSETKQVALLLRDCLLNLLKLKYYAKDGVKDENAVLTYKVEVSKIVAEATSQLDSNYKKITSSEGIEDPKWKHETNPVTVILAQINTIEDQIKKIQRSHYKLDDIAVSLETFSDEYSVAMQSRIQRSELLMQKISAFLETLQLTDLKVSKLELEKLIHTVEELVSQIDDQPELNPYSAIVIDDIDKIVLPVKSNGGNLQFKTIDIISEISSWTSFNLTGPLKMVDSVFHNYKERVSISLMQLANRLRAKNDPDNNEDIVFQSKELSKPILKLVDDYNTIVEPKVNAVLMNFQKEIKSNLKISKMFDDKLTFLPVSKLSQLSGGLTFQETLLRRYNFKNIIASFHSLTNNFFTKERRTKKLISASFVDKVLSFDPDTDSNALFMRKGFLGSSFFVDRPAVESEINSHFKLWEAGFGGGLLISGCEGSGRTTMLDVVTHHYNDNYNFYNVLNGGSLDVNGHKITVEKNLIQTLNEIIKYKGESRCIVKVDGIAEYVSSMEQVYDLMVELSKLINKHSHKVYFAFSIHESLLERLKQFFLIENTFTKIVNVSFMNKSSIVEALVMRAFAVADHDEVTYNSDKIREKANQVASKSGGNIGMAMLLWCMSGQEENVVSMTREFSDKILQYKYLFSYLLASPHLKIAQLKRYFDDVEFQNLKFDIEHLVHQKILVRHPGGIISIDPFIQQFVFQIINKK